MTKDSIEEIEHTADWSIRVQAEDLPSLFEIAAKGMFNLIGQPDIEAGAITHPITLQAADTETLLVSWLEELLFILDSEHLMLHTAQVQVASEVQLLATVTLMPPAELWKEIKAVTYHDLCVEETEAGFEVTLVFDV